LKLWDLEVSAILQPGRKIWTLCDDFDALFDPLSTSDTSRYFSRVYPP
jgi:hypothetical protein